MGFEDGDRVVVHVEFTSDFGEHGEQCEFLPKGRKGTVTNHEVNGNVVIDFDDLEAEVTVAKRNFDKLLKLESKDAPASGKQEHPSLLVTTTG